MDTISCSTVTDVEGGVSGSCVGSSDGSAETTITVTNRTDVERWEIREIHGRDTLVPYISHEFTRSTQTVSGTIQQNSVWEVVETASNLHGIADSRRWSTRLPRFRNMRIDWSHLEDRHLTSGRTATARRQAGDRNDEWPNEMNRQDIARSIRQAYDNRTWVSRSGDSNRFRVRGQNDAGDVIEMWVNRRTNTIETAYPLGRGPNI